MSFCLSNKFNRPYGYPEILSHLASLIGKRHCELDDKIINVKLEGHLENFIFGLEQILEIGSANAFDIQDLNNIITLIKNTSSDQLPYCADRICYLAQKILDSIQLSQPPNIVPFISDLWGIISHYAFAPHEMPYVTKTLQGWGWKELTPPIPTATIWDVVFQYLDLERATVPLPVYEGLLKLGEDIVLTDYAKIYHAEINPILDKGYEKVSNEIYKFNVSDHEKALTNLTSINCNLTSSDERCEKYWLERRKLSTRMPFELESISHFANATNAEDLVASFYGPILYREIIKYYGNYLNSSFLTLSPFLQTLILNSFSNVSTIENLLNHYRFLRCINLRNYPFSKVQIIENKYLRTMTFALRAKYLVKEDFQLYVKDTAQLGRISLRQYCGNFRLDVINSFSLKDLILSGDKGLNRIKLRQVPNLTYFSLSGDIESLDIDECPNLKSFIICFKNKIQKSNAYFNVNTTSIKYLKLEVQELVKGFDFPNHLLNVVLKQTRLKKLNLSNFQSLPDAFSCIIEPRLSSVNLYNVHEKIWKELSDNCTILTSQFQSPFKESKENTRIWSIIQSYEELQDHEAYASDSSYKPRLYDFFRKHGMFMEILTVFPKLSKKVQSEFFTIEFGND